MSTRMWWFVASGGSQTSQPTVLTLGKTKGGKPTLKTKGPRG